MVCILFLFIFFYFLFFSICLNLHKNNRKTKAYNLTSCTAEVSRVSFPPRRITGKLVQLKLWKVNCLVSWFCVTHNSTCHEMKLQGLSVGTLVDEPRSSRSTIPYDVQISLVQAHPMLFWSQKCGSDSKLRSRSWTTNCLERSAVSRTQYRTLQPCKCEGLALQIIDRKHFPVSFKVHHKPITISKYPPPHSSSPAHK